MRSLPPVILLDLDDTILRYSAVADECWEHVCARFAARLGDVSKDDLMAAIARYASWYWSDRERHRTGRLDMQRARRDIVRAAFAQLRLEGLSVADELADRFTTLREDWVRPFDGAREALAAFRDRGARLGLLTNGSAQFQRRKIERFDLARFFDVILIEGELGFGKPDHRVFHRALTALQATPSETWMIGDNLEWDIAPAQHLGIVDVWVDHAGTGLPPDSSITPTHTVAALAALIDAFP
ncbi:MAG: HAD family hydrolase [Deltaproteobacteria bacterium]|nr:HAD family hydrolase [Deltaproteobacteria bacterium]MBI3389867.1 HAD family hydrolase [Deltaproteobacteria bacterium]